MTEAAEAHALLALEYVPPDETVAYGDHPSQVIDFYRPAEPSGTRVTLLHGGFWREAYDRRHLAPLAAALAARGAEVALAEYRRVGGGGGWPETFDDVSTVLARDVPGGRHVLVGHSAGGHLALWAASTAPGTVVRVVAVAAVTDLGRARVLRLSCGAADELLGGEDRPEADPVRLGRPPVPTVLVHGEADEEVPADFSRRYAAAVGGPVGLRLLPGAGHYAVVTPGAAACDEVLAAIDGP
ncbi:alpha/beta hydrolase [Streptomyces sp. NPDC020379]|uniref:alpha/beta hydrolase n=1 Tax=Streptomyces sp. NPDC020379 TaxID=3365071 RepID=UPI0037BC0BED